MDGRERSFKVTLSYIHMTCIYKRLPIDPTIFNSCCEWLKIVGIIKCEDIGML